MLPSDEPWHPGHDDHGTDEPHAYLTGWLTAWIYEKAGWSPPSARPPAERRVKA